MKLTIGTYDIDITAHNRIVNDRAPDIDAGYFLNSIVIALTDAAKQLTRDGYDALADEQRRRAADIRDALTRSGFYSRA